MNKNLQIFAILFCLSILQLPSSAQVNTLDFFINQGLIHSPVLKDMNNQVSSNAIDSLLVKAGQKPQVGFNGLVYYAPVINGVGYSEVITNISSKYFRSLQKLITGINNFHYEPNNNKMH